MKNKKIFSIILYSFSILFLLIYLLMELNDRIFMSEFGRLFLLCGSCVFLYFGALLLSKYRKDNKPMKISLWIFFILYCILLITLTLFDPMWGRHGFNIFNWTSEYLNNYIESSFNLIPFATIVGYIKDIFNSLLDTRTIFFNIFGNFVCMMPFAFFLPLLFKKINNTKKFLLSILGVTIGIEVLQFITFTGSCDIDDVILNTLGAVVMYKILNIKDINNLIKNIFFLEKNKVNKKKVIKIFSIFAVIIILFLGFYKFSRSFYDKNLDDFMSDRNYQLEIVDETETCDTALEKFYEDELYEYYFNCIKSDNVYAIINNNEKYLVKDLLNNNPTSYVVTIDRLERAGLDFKKVNKYEELKFTIQSENIQIKEKIDDPELFEIKHSSTEIGLGKSSFLLYIIPKNVGTSYLTFNFINQDTDEIVETIKYNVIVNDDMTVTYNKIED